MKRLLADKNFPGSVIDALAAEGYDRAVLRLAHETGRWLLTFDADFGDLVFFHAAAAPSPILYFRIHPIVATEVLAAARRALAQAPTEHLAVIGRETLRLRRLPHAK